MSRSRRSWVVALVLGMICAGGCARAARPRWPAIVPDDQAALRVQQADTLVREGCYPCLEEAAALYEQVASATGAIDAGRKLVDTRYLMALRERELGLWRAGSLDQARAAAARLPVPWDYDIVDRLVRASGWRSGSVPRDPGFESFDDMRAVRADGLSWRARLAPARAHDPLASYLLLSFDCQFPFLSREQAGEPWSPDPRQVPPLLAARLATCGGPDGDALERLMRDHPRYAELHLALGDVGLGQRRLRTAERHYVLAIEALPALQAARLKLGDVYLAMEEVELARQAYHDVVADMPSHREALLGEVKTLSHLGRGDEAMASATRMIDLGTWYLGEAHYWRGWNRLRAKQTDAAADDVRESRSRLPMDPQVDKLAGLVALARSDAPQAEREFALAVEHVAGRGSRDCEAGYYLASAQVLQQKWTEAGPMMEQAIGCFGQDITEARARIAEIGRSDLPDERKARLTAAKTRQIDTLDGLQGRSAYNAAVAYYQAGERDRAKPLAERAASHQEFAEQARTLLERIR